LNHCGEAVVAHIKAVLPSPNLMYWARDLAIATPRGLVLGRSRHCVREFEHSFVRFVFRYAHELSNTPVVFDAAEADLFLDGGDVIVLNEHELLLGVGNRTSEEAAPRLAEALGMDVMAVRMPSRDVSTRLAQRLPHLDTIFSLVDTHVALAVPFLLERSYTGANPLTPAILRELRREDDQETSDALDEVGWVTHYQAGTGLAVPMHVKLVDWIRDRGYRVVFVGGEPDSNPSGKRAIETVLREMRSQGANVLPLRPGVVVAYAQNTRTNAALAQTGIQVEVFEGRTLAARIGGPHCLVMPLVRDR
jgi:arginine deiminase